MQLDAYNIWKNDNFIKIWRQEKSYDWKTTLEVIKSFYPNGRPNHPATDFTLREETSNGCILALRVKSNNQIELPVDSAGQLRTGGQSSIWLQPERPGERTKNTASWTNLSFALFSRRFSKIGKSENLGASGFGLQTNRIELKFSMRLDTNLILNIS